MLDALLTTRINSDVSDEDIKPGEYRDALNISLIANEVGAFSKGTTYGNIDTNIIFKGLNPDAICLGSAVDTAGVRGIVAFYQRIAKVYEPEYQGILDYAISRGMQIPSVAVQNAQNYLITLLKRDGIWTGLDVFFCFYGDGDSSFARINWKTPNDATLAINNGMTYNPNYGFKGNGTSANLNTKFVPSAAVKFTQNDAEFVLGVEELFQNNQAWDGVEFPAGSRAQIASYYNINTAAFSCGGGTNSVVADPSITTAAGLMFASRPNSGTMILKKNTGSPLVVGVASTPRAQASFLIGALNNISVVSNYNINRYSLFAAGENLATFDRENKFYDNWTAYKNSFAAPLVSETYSEQVLMYLITDPIGGLVAPIVKSIKMQVTERSYLDGYSFVNELFYFNFRQSAPKMINIQRALDSPGFYDELSETLLTVIKPHPPYAPVPLRVILGIVPNPPIQKKPFQFMFLYRFSDGETSTKSPASEYLNSLDDFDTTTSMYDTISVTMDFPLKDYPLVKEVELYVRNNNGGVVDWRSVSVFKRELFVQAGDVYRFAYMFTDTAVGAFLPEEQATKINESVPQRSNYLAFIENRLFVIDSLLDYDFTPTFQIRITLDSNSPTKDDRLTANDPRYATSEFEYDSNYMIGIAFYDAYGRKYPASIANRVLTTPRYVPAILPLPGNDFLPSEDNFTHLRKPKITAKYDLRAVGNIANYGKPPGWAFWWGMIRSKNIKWEFQKSIQCLLRFPYSITKWPGTDPATFPQPAELVFLEDGYLYWNPNKLLYGTDGSASHPFATNMVNDYIDVVIPSNFPYPLDKNVLIDFMLEVTGSTATTRHQIIDREVVDIFANKIRIRGNRDARWFSSVISGVGHYRSFPKITTGVNLTGTGTDGKVLFQDETTMPVIIKRLRRNTLESTLLYDTPQIYPVTRAGSTTAAFQPGQSATIQRTEYAPVYTTPSFDRTLSQGDILIQPVHLTPTTVAFNHRIKILWGPNSGDSLRLKIKVSLWQLNDLNQPILELYSSTGLAGAAYYVKNLELSEYLITPLAEVTDGWFGYGIQILEATASSVNFENPDFDITLSGWLQSTEGAPALAWLWGSVLGNFAYVSVPAMGTGYSKTLYQYLYGITKNDISIEVIIEGVNVLGPVANASILQHPGNSGNPSVHNASDQIFDLARSVTPYYIDCSTPVRRVNMFTLSYSLFTAAPLGSQARAELWRLNQTTKQPISMIEGSEGAWTAIGAIGENFINFGAANLIDTTGWYGVSIYVDLPTFANFLNSNYASGGTSWEIKTGGGSVTWVFQPDTVVSATYENLVFAPAIGAFLGDFGIESSRGSGTPIFFPNPTVDPAGYDQIQIYLHWGDNTLNGWQGKTITAYLWDVNQFTKQIISPSLYNSLNTIQSFGANYVTITGSKIPGNKWYAIGLGNMTGHPDPTRRQFTNSKFIDATIAPWNTTVGSASNTWTKAGNSIVCALDSSAFFDTGKFIQGMNGYLEAVLGDVFVTGSFSQLVAHIYVDGTLIYDVTVTSAMGSGSTTDPYWITFPCVQAGGGQIAFSFTGQKAVGAGSQIFVGCVLNALDVNMGASPVIRQFVVADANNASWRTQGNLGIVDPDWRYGYKYWKRTNTGAIGPSSAVIRVDDSSSGQPLELNFNSSSSTTVTPLIYGMINMVGGASATFFVDFDFVLSVFRQTFFEVWAFNDPATFNTGGSLIYQISISSSTNITATPITVPGGYKYIGYRTVLASGQTILSLRRATWVHQDSAYYSWDKQAFTMQYRAYVRHATTLPTTITANYYADSIAAGGSSRRLGQTAITGVSVRVNIEIYAGLSLNNYTVTLTDAGGIVLGSTSVTGQALSTTSSPVNPAITVDASVTPTQTGLFLMVRNDNGSGVLSVRLRQITNVNAPVYIGADSTIVNARTWHIDSVGTMMQQNVTTHGRVGATSDTPLVADPMEVILADAAGTPISAVQTFQPNDGQKRLVFSPTLQVDGNYNYGVKVRNVPTNLTTSGTIRIHSINNIATNDGVAHIVGNTISPAQPLYEAWNQFSLGSFVRAGYVSNFIAVVNDLIMSAFTPVQINPSAYHLVHNVVPAGIPGHSTSYGLPADGFTPYLYGHVYPSVSSDPDAAGIVFEQKTGCSLGDVSFVNIDLRERSHSNIVRWSDPIIAGTQTNNLNAFLDSNKYAVDFQRGGIEVMIAMHDHTIFCVHTQGMSSLYVSRSTMISPAEVQGQADQLFLTSKIIGNDNKLTSNLGTVNPESCRVVESGTIGYGFDLVRKSFWQKTNNGVRNLTYECHAKKFFENICFYRLKAYLDGEDIKIYSGYNEKQKSFYLTFAPFVYKGQAYPGITVAYNAYIDGFLSRYSFEPMSYLSTEDVLHSIEVRELTNPDFFGDFDFWKTSNDNGGTTDWYQSLIPAPGAKSNTIVPPGTRILNPDFAQAQTFWPAYGGGSSWTFDNDGATTIIPAGGSSKDLVNSSGALGEYLVRIKAQLPTTGITFSIKIYNPAGVAIQTPVGATALTGDNISTVIQLSAGRVGVIFTNTTGVAKTLHVSLISTVVKTFLLYQPVPLLVEDLRLRVSIPARTGSIKVVIESFSLDLFTRTVLHTIDLVQLKSAYTTEVIVPSTVAAKNISLYAITDYDLTIINYFNANTVPSIWEHDRPGRTNNFFGAQYDTMIDMIFNVQQGQVRIFNSLGIMSETAWSVESFLTSEGQISALDKANFRLRDGIYSSAIMRDMLTPQESLPDPVNNIPLVHGRQLVGTVLQMVLRNSETLRQIELRAVYIGSDILSGNLLGRQ